jgi:hypothetical protein
MGAAAALHALDRAADPAVALPALWQPAQPPPGDVATMLSLVQEGMRRFNAWQAADFPDLTKMGL